MVSRAQGVCPLPYFLVCVCVPFQAFGASLNQALHGKGITPAKLHQVRVNSSSLAACRASAEEGGDPADLWLLEFRLQLAVALN